MALFGVGVVLPPSGAVLLPPATGAVGSEAAPWPGAVGAVVGVVLDEADELDEVAPPSSVPLDVWTCVVGAAYVVDGAAAEVAVCAALGAWVVDTPLDHAVWVLLWLLRPKLAPVRAAVAAAVVLLLLLLLLPPWWRLRITPAAVPPPAAARATKLRPTIHLRRPDFLAGP